MGGGGLGEEGGYKVTSDIKLDQNKNCLFPHERPDETFFL